MIVVVTVLNSGSDVSITSSDLQNLVEQTNPESPGDASIIVTERQKQVRYSGLSGLRFAPYRVTGNITREEGGKAENVTF